MSELPLDIWLLVRDIFQDDLTLDPHGKVSQDIVDSHAAIMNLAGTSRRLAHLSKLHTPSHGRRSIVAFNPGKLLDQSHQDNSANDTLEKQTLANVIQMYITSITGPSLDRRLTGYSARHDNLYKDCHAIFEAARARMEADPTFLSNIESFVFMSGARWWMSDQKIRENLSDSTTPHETSFDLLQMANERGALFCQHLSEGVNEVSKRTRPSADDPTKMVSIATVCPRASYALHLYGGIDPKQRRMQAPLTRGRLQCGPMTWYWEGPILENKESDVEGTLVGLHLDSLARQFKIGGLEVRSFTGYLPTLSNKSEEMKAWLAELVEDMEHTVSENDNPLPLKNEHGEPLITLKTIDQAREKPCKCGHPRFHPTEMSVTGDDETGAIMDD